MNAALLIAGRELRDKTRVFVTAAAMSAMPFLAALLTQPKGDPNAVVVVAGVLGILLTVGITIVLGATTIGRELSDGRLSFYFSKPIPPAAVWIGKAAAALLTALIAFAIVTLPAILYALQSDRSTITWDARPVRIAAVAGVAIFLVIHAASTFVRSRSWLLAVDFVLLTVAVIAVAAILRPLVLAQAMSLVRRVGEGLIIGMIVILAAAPAWQLSVGRTDRRRSHAALSKVLWPAVAVILLVAAGYVANIVRVAPNELVREYEVAQVPATGSMFVTGRSAAHPDYQASFLVDGEGRYERTQPPWWGAAFSRDGRRLAWLQPTDLLLDRDMEVFTRDLTKRDARAEATGITFPGHGEIVLSDDGGRLALRQGPNLSVHDLGSKRMLFSGKVMPNDAMASFYFARPDLVRVMWWPRGASRAHKVSPTLVDVDVARRSVSTTGTIEPVEYPMMIASEDGSRLLFRREAILVDGRTGATLARYGESGLQPGMLRDGTVVVPSPMQQPAYLTIHRPDGTSVKVELPGARYAIVRGEVAPGKIAVQGGEAWVSGYNAQKAKVFIVNAATGAIERVDDKVRGPLVAHSNIDPRPLSMATGRPLAALDEAGNIVMWNPLTGERKKVEFKKR